MKPSILSELVGKHIEIISISGQTRYNDTGVLRAFDDQWVCLDKNGGTLYFSIARIRLIKPI